MRQWPLVVGATLYGLSIVGAAALAPSDDAPGSPDVGLMVMLVWLGVGLLGIAAASVAVVRRSTVDWLSIPHRAYWTDARRLPQARRMLEEDVVRVMGAVLVILTPLPLGMVLTALDAAPGVSTVLLWAPVVACVVAGVPWVVHHHRVRYRPPSAADA